MRRNSALTSGRIQEPIIFKSCEWLLIIPTFCRENRPEITRVCYEYTPYCSETNNYGQGAVLKEVNRITLIPSAISLSLMISICRLSLRSRLVYHSVQSCVQSWIVPLYQWRAAILHRGQHSETAEHPRHDIHHYRETQVLPTRASIRASHFSDFLTAG